MSPIHQWDNIDCPGVEKFSGVSPTDGSFRSLELHDCTYGFQIQIILKTAHLKSDRSLDYNWLLFLGGKS
jgi:predicted TIM-barrel enzyme